MIAYGVTRPRVKAKDIVIDKGNAMNKQIFPEPRVWLKLFDPQDQLWGGGMY